MKLKQVCLILSCEKRLEELANLLGKLQQCGVSCEVKIVGNESSEHSEARVVGKIMSVSDGTVITQGMAVSDNAALNGKLYLSDCAIAVRELCEKGLPVLAFLHEENRRGDFLEARYACEEAGELEPEYLERVYRRFVRLPWNILETKHCILRESVEDDTEAFRKIYEEPEVTRYMESLQESRVGEPAYIREYIENMYEYYEFGIWTVILKETGEIIGRAGLSMREGFELPELGYVLGRAWQRRGLAKEVCEGILQYAREEFDFDRVQALIEEENEASIGLAIALGFEKRKEYCEKGRKMFVFVRRLA